MGGRRAAEVRALGLGGTTRTTTSHITVDGLAIEVVRKDIKHLHLRVYSPEGRVRVSAPMRARDKDVRAFVTSKMAWIRRHLARLEAQPRRSAPRYVSGESHYFRGRPYLLHVTYRPGRPSVAIRSGDTIEMGVPRATDVATREHVLVEWDRARLKEAMPRLVAKWEAVVGVNVAEWRVKRMKTRWGSCNVQARRIWVNLELAKRPVRCLEYVIVHEMAHLLERRHNDRFRALMDVFMPGWRTVREELNQAPIGHSGRCR